MVGAIAVWFICGVIWLVMALWSIADRKCWAAIIYGIICIGCFSVCGINIHQMRVETLEPGTVIIVSDTNETETYEDAIIKHEACIVVTDKNGIEHFYPNDIDYIKKDK
jgi:hypothetical protein